MQVGDITKYKLKKKSLPYTKNVCAFQICEHGDSWTDAS